MNWILAAFGTAFFIWFLREMKKGLHLILVPEILPSINTPEHFGLAYEKVKFKSEDGAEIHGWWIEGGGDKTIVLSHGWSTNRGDILPSTWYLAKEGFNLLYFDFRGCGESPRHGFSSLGFFEQRDLNAALDFVRREKAPFARRIALFGLSMGASVSLAAGRENADLRCAFLEAPFSSFSEVIERYMKFHYWNIPKPFVWFYLFLLRAWTGFVDHEGVSPWRTARGCKIPVLSLAYGEKDWLAPVSDGERLLKTLREEARVEAAFWRVPAASHADCFGRYPELYRRELVEFYKSNLNSNE